MLKATGLAIAVLISSTAFAQRVPEPFSFRKTVTPQGLGGTFAIPLYGRDLPPGSGHAAAGAKIFAARCAVCHGSLETKTPANSMDSCWRYTKPMFNYVKRAMPLNAPGSLKNGEIYALVAYMLSEAGIIRPDEVMNAKSLPKVVMPNRDGLIPNFCPQLSLHR